MIEELFESLDGWSFSFLLIDRSDIVVLWRVGNIFFGLSLLVKICIVVKVIVNF